MSRCILIADGAVNDYFRRRPTFCERQPPSATAAPNIPPKVSRVWKNCFSPYPYRGRNAIERMFNRLKDFRRIATRYDRLATNFHAAVCIAAVVSYWL
jgi:transposase